MIRALPALLILLATAAPAQVGRIETTPLPDYVEPEEQPTQIPEIRLLSDDDFQTFEQEVRVEQSEAGVIKVLDKMNGSVQELEIAAGDAVNFGFLTISLQECRYPAENPSSDAFARLSILPVAGGEILFDGWMIASSPALMALDHPRYDVWVVKCRFEGPDPEVADGARSPRPPQRP